MYHSNLARAPTLPLLSKLSIRPIPPLRSHRRTYSSFNPLHTTKSHLIHLFPKTPDKPRPSGFRIFSRSVHQRAPEAAGARSGAKTPLPWIRDSKGAEKKPKPKPKPATKTSWEAAAERYLSKSEVSIVENADREPKLTTTDREEAEEDGDTEHVDNPRWSKIKSKYAGFVGRDRESRFENPEEDGDGDGEPVDNPRWSKVKSKYTDFVARDRGSRFEKPEVHRWNKQESWGRKTWKEATESSVPRMVGQGVYGVGPVLAALSIARREFYALYVQEGLDLSGNSKKKKDKKGVEKVMRIADKIGLKVVEASKHDLNMVVDNRPHQGLVLDAPPVERSYTELIRISGGITINESGGDDEFESESKEVEQSFTEQKMQNFLAVESLNVSVAAWGMFSLIDSSQGQEANSRHGGHTYGQLKKDDKRHLSIEASRQACQISIETSR